MTWEEAAKEKALKLFKKHGKTSWLWEWVEDYGALNYTGFEKIYLKLTSQIEELKKENERLKNDLLDALDLKEGNGPTALTMLSDRVKKLEAEKSELRNKTIDEVLEQLGHAYNLEDAEIKIKKLKK